MDTRIFTKREIDRISESEENGVKVITVDLHRMGRDDARLFLKNIIALNFRDEFRMDVIHGYIHGTRLKRMIRKKPLSSRVISVTECPWNKGLSYLNVRASYT